MNRTSRFDNYRRISISDSEEEMEEITLKLTEMMVAINSLQLKYDDLSAQPQPSGVTPAAFGDYFRIPDPIKSLPTFEGNKKQLTSWLNTAEDTLNLFRDKVPVEVFRMYTTAVSNKITGKAKDILCTAGNPTDFVQIKEILISSLGDRQELSTYKCQLWQNRMSDSTNIHKYYAVTQEIVQNIKTLVKQKEKYRNNWDSINCFIDEDALAAFIAGLREPYFGHAQAARPRDIEDAYAFLCKYKAQELNAMAHERGPKKSFNQTHQRNHHIDEKSKLAPNKPTRAYSEKRYQKQQDVPEPMDIDHSLRSKLSRKQYNNNEADTEDGSSDEEKEEQAEPAEGNFCIGGKDKENL